MSRRSAEARAEVIGEKGTDRRRFQEGLVSKYTWQSLGSSYVLSDLLAAVLWSQLPVTESVSGRLPRLPFYTRLSRADQARVIAVVLRFSA